MTKKPKSIVLPNQISFLVKAINCDNENAARLLIKQAMLLTYNLSNHWPKEKARTNDDLDAVVSLIRQMQHNDAVLRCGYIVFYY